MSSYDCPFIYLLWWKYFLFISRINETEMDQFSFYVFDYFGFWSLWSSTLYDLVPSSSVFFPSLLWKSVKMSVHLFIKFRLSRRKKFNETHLSESMFFDPNYLQWIPYIQGRDVFDPIFIYDIINVKTRFYVISISLTIIIQGT